MKTPIIDIDNLKDFIALVELHSTISFVDVQNPLEDTLFFPLVKDGALLFFTCSLAEGVYKKTWPQKLPIYPATLENV